MPPLFDNYEFKSSPSVDLQGNNPKDVSNSFFLRFGYHAVTLLTLGGTSDRPNYL